VNFENTVIIMTTNAGAVSVGSTGFTATEKESDETRIRTALEAFLRPEFLNRVDEIVVFNRLTRQHFSAICAIMLGELKQVLAEKDVSFTWTEGVIDHLADKGFSEKYGARNLRRLIQRDLEDLIALELVTRYQETVTAIAADAGEKGITLQVL
jgi:ATP-dependent Clp protease ATP-binding subunit ClpA